MFTGFPLQFLRAGVVFILYCDIMVVVSVPLWFSTGGLSQAKPYYYENTSKKISR